MSEPRVVLFDLETLPNPREAIKVWPSLSNYPGLTLKAQVSTIICFGWKVLGKSEPVRCINAWDFPSWKKDVNDDRALVEEAREVLDGADAVVTHNGKKFDWKFFQTRLAKHGLTPLDPKLPHYDTKQISSRHLYLSSNSLGNIGEYLLADRKMDHEGWSLWVKVFERDAKAMKTMSNYCKQDVLLLEKAYLKLRPYIRTVNHNLFNPFKEKVCPSCGSSRIQKHGKRRTQTKVYQRYHCPDCGATCSSDVRDELLR